MKILLPLLLLVIACKTSKPAGDRQVKVKTEWAHGDTRWNVGQVSSPADTTHAAAH